MLAERRAIGHSVRVVVELEVCTWHGSGHDSRVLVDPSDDQIKNAIRRLNGADRNDLYLRDAEGAWMGIAVGPDRVIVTFAASEDGPFSQAIDATVPSEPEVEIVVGGQMVTQPPSQLFDVSVASGVACEFARTGLRSTAVAWTDAR